MKSNPFMASKDNTVKGPLLDEECSHAQVLTFLLGRGSLSTVLCDPWPQSVGSSFFSSLAVSEVGIGEPTLLTSAQLSQPSFCSLGFPDSLVGKERIHLQCKRPWFNSWVGKIRWRRDRLPTPVYLGFPGGSVGKESACNAGDLGSIPGLGRSPGEGQGYPLQYSGLENSMGCVAV